MSTSDSKGQRQADHWQKKYYDSLQELEEKETEWNEAEKMLRALVSRLSVVIHTGNKELDKHIDKLRRSIRDTHDVLRLKPLAADINAGIAALGEMPAASTESPTRLLSQLLDELNVPKELGKQAKQVQKALDKSKDSSEIQDSIKLIITFIEKLVEVIVEKRIKEGGQGDKQGLLSSLFKKRKDDTGTEQHLAGPELEAGLEDTSSHDISVASSQEQVETESSEEALFLFAGEMLIQLLERMELPNELQLEAALIRKGLEPCRDDETLMKGLDATADLLVDYQARIHKEKQELQAFLIQLTSRLQELDKDIQQTARLRELGYKDSQSMNAAVNEEVNQIQNSVDTSTDFETLKTDVQSRIIVIRNHVDRFLEREEDRNDDSKQTIERLTQQLLDTESQVDMLRRQVELEQHKAMTDSLTGVPNRLAYEKNLHDELNRFKRYQSPFVLMVWDVDKFKSINDTYGHAAGDKVLKIIAGILQKNVRETDKVARYGGEEFVVLLPETSMDAAKQVAEKLRSAIESTEFHFRTTPVKITASCGLAEVSMQDTGKALFERADNALYQAKENGRNRVEVAG